MITVSEILEQLSQLGSAQTRKTYARHGAPDAMFGVKVGDLKGVAKQIKGNQKLALELYDTGNSDAMYLAGMVADGSQMTQAQLNRWARNASWYMIAEYTVPGVAHEHAAATQLAVKWMHAKSAMVTTSGWTTYAGVLATREDKALDLAEIKALLAEIESGIDQAPNRVRYTMNGFVISVGAYVKPLLKQAKSVASRIGKVEVHMGDTACKTPFAPDYIAKIEKLGRVGKKRKTIKC